MPIILFDCSQKVSLLFRLVYLYYSQFYGHRKLLEVS